jgi:hypothetical protein
MLSLHAPGFFALRRSLFARSLCQPWVGDELAKAGIVVNITTMLSLGA